MQSTNYYNIKQKRAGASATTKTTTVGDDNEVENAVEGSEECANSCASDDVKVIDDLCMWIESLGADLALAL
ncbi:YdiU family protein [Sesbania bispinosa]|nr:YdiU family protein [Sesbania bispinosa]